MARAEPVSPARMSSPTALEMRRRRGACSVVGRTWSMPVLSRGNGSAVMVAVGCVWLGRLGGIDLGNPVPGRKM